MKKKKDKEENKKFTYRSYWLASAIASCVKKLGWQQFLVISSALGS
jgi:hypothetical protein